MRASPAKSTDLFDERVEIRLTEIEPRARRVVRFFQSNRGASPHRLCGALAAKTGTSDATVCDGKITGASPSLGSCAARSPPIAQQLVASRSSRQHN